jgi:hypothetical protein
MKQLNNRYVTFLEVFLRIPQPSNQLCCSEAENEQNSHGHTIEQKKILPHEDVVPWIHFHIVGYEQQHSKKKENKGVGKQGNRQTFEIKKNQKKSKKKKSKKKKKLK